MKKGKIEALVGIFVLLGLAAVFYMAVQLGGLRVFGGDTYEVEARFGSVSGVNEGSRVEIAGVRVGTVSKIELNENFFAIVTLRLPERVELDQDTMASVKTSGLIGERFIQLSPGGAPFALEPGDMIVDTESAMDIESLISRFALGGVDEEEE